MNNVFIIHGTCGYPEENWFPWLKSELEKLGCKVFVPKFPTPENQSLENWLRVFEDYKQYLNKDSIVVGHSLGPAFLLNILEKVENPIKAAFFISGFTGVFGDSDFNKINKTFVDKVFDWKKIKRNCPKFFLFHSNNDPHIPLEKAEEFTKSLDVDLNIIENAGHFNKEAGYVKFELLLEKIKNELS